MSPCVSRLQRDFSVYLVNAFDTAVAARVMGMPGGASLANLLKLYSKKNKDRKMQLADWRVRSEEGDSSLLLLLLLLLSSCCCCCCCLSVCVFAVIAPCCCSCV